MKTMMSTYTFFHFHVFDTKKEEISDKKFFTSLFPFHFQFKNLLFFSILFFKLASTISCIFVLFSIILAISLSLYFFSKTFFLKGSCISNIELHLSRRQLSARLLRSSPVMLSENKH